jgi:hypothetical protein
VRSGSPEVAPTVTEVFEELFDPEERSGLAVQFLGLFDTAISAACREIRFFNRHSLTLELLLQQRQVSLDLARHLALGAAPAEQIRKSQENSPHGSRSFGEQLFNQSGHPSPAARFLGQRALAGFGNRVEFCLPITLRLAPGPFDPALLFQTHQCGIERALVQMEQSVGDLLEPRRDRVGVLRPHALQGPQDYQIKRSLKHDHPIYAFT